jgi:hypothetical protein
MNAAAAALEWLSGVAPDWNRTERDAQSGDALIKLAAYRAEALGSAEGASRWLQDHENNHRLAVLFDELKAEDIEEFRVYGPGLGTKRKETLVEALIWWRFGARVLGPDGAETLAEIFRRVAQSDFSSDCPK